MISVNAFNGSSIVVLCVVWDCPGGLTCIAAMDHAMLQRVDAVLSDAKLKLESLAEADILGMWESVRDLSLIHI